MKYIELSIKHNCFIYQNPINLLKEMDAINEIITEIIKFRDDRDWKQFHNSKDLAVALSIEASELLELFLWKGQEEFNEERLKEELADVLMYAFLLAEKNQINIKDIILDKIQKNTEKYPIEKAKGTAKKYNEL